MLLFKKTPRKLLSNEFCFQKKIFLTKNHECKPQKSYPPEQQHFFTNIRRRQMHCFISHEKIRLANILWNLFVLTVSCVKRPLNIVRIFSRKISWQIIMNCFGNYVISVTQYPLLKITHEITRGFLPAQDFRVIIQFLRRDATENR